MSKTGDHGAYPTENPPSPKADVLWISCSTSAEVAVSVILNRYSSQIPLLAVFGICAIPVLLLLAVVIRHEKRRGWIRHNFLQHPVSITLLALVFAPFFWYSTSVLVHKAKGYSGRPKTSVRSPRPLAPREGVQTANATPSDRQEGSKPEVAKVPSVSTHSKVKRVGHKSSSPDQVQTTPTFNIEGNTGNVAGVNNGTQIFNEFPKPRVISAASMRRLTEALDLSRDKGTVLVKAASSAPDVFPLTQQICKALSDAKWGLYCPMSRASQIGKEESEHGIECFAANWETGDATAFKKAFRKTSLNCSYISHKYEVGRGPMMEYETQNLASGWPVNAEITILIGDPAGNK